MQRLCKQPLASVPSVINLLLPLNRRHSTSYTFANTLKRYTISGSNLWLDYQLTALSLLFAIPNTAKYTRAFTMTGGVLPQIPLQVIRHWDSFIGSCSLTRHERKSGEGELELSYYLSPGYYGRRAMGAAARIWICFFVLLVRFAIPDVEEEIITVRSSCRGSVDLMNKKC
ncbi:hypothetical protein BGZ60DRAFT_280532 [Tricladium varicosporioides]|nr:hypothetical protein BGZ60DRAFT_280532 [Hymenoscyphus varicosporioides]